jgi:hypothetical protein
MGTVSEKKYTHIFICSKLPVTNADGSEKMHE